MARQAMEPRPTSSSVIMGFSVFSTISETSRSDDFEQVF